MAAESIHRVLLDAGMIRATDPNERAPYKLTSGGRLYVDALQSVPIPIQKWVIP